MTKYVVWPMGRPERAVFMPRLQARMTINSRIGSLTALPHTMTTVPDEDDRSAVAIATESESEFKDLTGITSVQWYDPNLADDIRQTAQLKLLQHMEKLKCSN